MQALAFSATPRPSACWHPTRACADCPRRERLPQQRLLLRRPAVLASPPRCPRVAALPPGEPEGKAEEEAKASLESASVAVALSLLAFYRREISPLMPRSCRFVPSCSEYSIEAFKKFGFWRGGLLTAWRLLRCNPLNPKSGYDPPAWPPFQEAAVDDSSCPSATRMMDHALAAVSCSAKAILVTPLCTSRPSARLLLMHEGESWNASLVALLKTGVLDGAALLAPHSGAVLWSAGGLQGALDDAAVSEQLVRPLLSPDAACPSLVLHEKYVVVHREPGSLHAVSAQRAAGLLCYALPVGTLVASFRRPQRLPVVRAAVEACCAPLLAQ